MRVGIIAGNFDVIHPGYINMFNQCVENCDKLIILLQGDPTIERPEKCKPVLSIKERTDILLSLRQISEVIVYNIESELYTRIKELNPDVRFLGDDYIGRSFTGDDLPIVIHFLERSHGWSTTKFKNLISESIKKEDI
jgi:glycerol-3-phosphate cytidylyltransferase